MTDAWINRREFHADAPRLADLVADAGCFEAGEVAHRRVSVDAPWGDAERLWDRFLTRRRPGARVPPRPSRQRRCRDATYCRSAPIGNEQVDDVVEPNRVLEHYAAGATVVLQALQFTDPVFAELSTNLALELDHPVQVNAYLTPPAERGLDIHFDFHDVVVVQLAGRKRWHVWPALAASGATAQARARRSPNRRQTSSARRLLDRVLERGDCLAIPRGFPHAAETVDAESAHLTIGIMALTWNRVAARPDRRHRLGLGARRSSALRRSRRTRRRRPPAPDDALATLSDRLTDDRLRHAVAAEVWRRQPQTRLRPRRPVAIDVDSPSP